MSPDEQIALTNRLFNHLIDAEPSDGAHVIVMTIPKEDDGPMIMACTCERAQAISAIAQVVAGAGE